MPARFVDGEILPLREDEGALGATRDKILASAPKAASEVLAGLKPRFIRDQNNVIQCAVLESNSPLTASAVLAPEFSTFFSELLGPIFSLPFPIAFESLCFQESRPRFSVSRRSLSRNMIPLLSGQQGAFLVRKGKLIAIGSYR